MMATVKRSDLASAIAERLEQIDREHAARLVDDVLDPMADAIAEDGLLGLSGFGTITVRKKRARICRNPKTLEPATISGRYVLMFR
jgi:integration host factor subunit alpha